jgi:hypothetical protein
VPCTVTLYYHYRLRTAVLDFAAEQVYNLMVAEGGGKNFMSKDIYENPLITRYATKK